MSALPACWRVWEARIREHLSLNGEPLETQELENPWFLVSSLGELSEIEHRQLFDAVRTTLFRENDSDPGLAQTRKMVRSLTGEDVLPLLYALRVIATYPGASTVNYWPLVAEHLFGSRETYYPRILSNLPALFTELWERLYQASGRRLYFPQEGRTNLKWPLAHAGLLQKYQKELKEFGQQLYDTAGGKLTAAPLSEEDFAQFSQQLRQKAPGSLKEQLLDETIGPVLCELAQFFVRRAWDQFSLSKGSSKSYQRLPQVQLVFDTSYHNVLWEVTAGTFSEPLERAELLWGEERYELVLHDGGRRTYANRQLLPPPLDHQWPTSAMLQTTEGVHNRKESHSLSVAPIFRSGQSILFSAASGSLVRRLSLGEAYFLLLPCEKAGQRTVQDALEVISDDVAWLGSVWESHRVVRLTARSLDMPPVSEQRSKLSMCWNEAMEALGLLSISNLWKPRYSLVGFPMKMRPGEEPTYLTTERPLLHISGDANGRTLFLQQKQRDGWEDLAKRRLAPQESSGLFNLFSGQVSVSAGHYRLKSDQEFLLEFSLTEKPENLTPSIGSRLTLSLGEASSTWGAQKGQGRSALENGVLHVSGWPYANVSLAIETASGSACTVVPLTLDEQGTGRIKGRDLGLGSSFAGTLRLTAEWGGIFRSNLLEIGDGPYVRADELEVSRTTSQGTHRLGVRGVLQGCTTHQNNLTAWFIGEAPWQGNLKQAQVAVDPNGIFTITVSEDPLPFHWLFISLKTDSDHIPLLVASLTNTPLLPSEQQVHRTKILDAGEEYCETWTDLATQLRTLPLPPSLEPLVGIGVLPLIDDWAQRLAPRRAVWRSLHTRSRLKAAVAYAQFLQKQGWPTKAVLFLNPSHYSKMTTFTRTNLIPHIRQEHPTFDATALTDLLSGVPQKISFGGEIITIECLTEYGTKEVIYSVTTGKSILNSCRSCGVVGVSSFSDHHLPFLDPPKSKCIPSLRTHNPESTYDKCYTLAIAPQPLRLLAYFQQLILVDAEQIDLGLAVPSTAKRWLGRIAETRPPEACPEDWIRGLLRMLRLLEKEAYENNKKPHTLRNLGELFRLTEAYAPALEIITEWFEKELKP